jgi:hypothetical protein
VRSISFSPPSADTTTTTTTTTTDDDDDDSTMNEQVASDIAVYDFIDHA